jgi:hypothetical protein
MESWRPFELSSEEYRDVLSWWNANHPGDVEDSFGVDRWNDRVQELLNGESDTAAD